MLSPAKHRRMKLVEGAYLQVRRKRVISRSERASAREPQFVIQEDRMVKLGLYVRLEAKPGKEKEVEAFLQQGGSMALDEPQTKAWFAIRMGPSTFGIFDVFEDEAGRQAHLTGKIAEALMAKAPDLLAQPPKIEKIDILASKLPT
jgi:quinol monooxygenase YgiN